MTRRDMAIQGAMGLILVCGIVGGNFLLHRWVIGSAASREANADTSPVGSLHDDLDEFAPRRRVTIIPDDSKTKLVLLRKLIAAKLPEASVEVREAWLQELSGVTLKVAEGILDLRGQVGAFPEIDETAQPRTSPVRLPELDFTIGVSRE